MAQKKVEVHPRVDELLYWQNIHGTVQKSDAWLEARRTCITASDVASVLGDNPYSDATSVLLSKLGITPRFNGNDATRHGEKYEPIAIQRYETLNTTTVHEFGLLHHPTISGLAGSPDGITESGILIEVKVRF